MSEKNTKTEYFVEGMHCAACELFIENKISKMEGVIKVNAELKSGKIHIEGERIYSASELTKEIEENGYKIIEGNTNSKRTDWDLLAKAFGIALIIILFFFALQKFDVIRFASTTESVTLPFVFLIGAIASLSTCMAVVGGIVLTLSSHFAKEGRTQPLIIFHISRIVGFFVLGGVIGLLGSAFTLSGTATLIINLILFFTMIILAFNMLGIFPQLQRFQIKMPKIIGKNVLRLNSTSNILLPLLLGALTFFLPCGFTQSMQLYSLTTGSFLNGALTMMTFALGTFPVLALVSFISTKFSKTLQAGLFYKTAGFIIIFFAIFNLYNALSAIGAF